MPLKLLERLPRRLRSLSSGFVARFFRKSAWGIAANGILIGLGIVQVGIVTRMLGVEQYGVYAVITVFPNLVQGFAGFRTWDFVARYCTEALEAGDGVRAGDIALIGWSVDGAVALLTILIVLIGGRWYLHSTLGATAALPLVYICALISVANAGLSTSQALLRVFDRFDWLFWHSAGTAALRLGLMTAVYFLHPGLTGVVIAATLTSFVAAASAVLLSLIQGRRYLRFDISRRLWHFVQRHAREFASFLGAGYVDASAQVLAANLDTVLLARMGGAAEAGLYRAARLLIANSMNLLTPMIQAILPDLQRSLSLSRGELKRRLIGLTVSVGAVATLGAATTSVLAPWLLRIVLGAEFAGAATAVRIMIWSVALFGSVFWLSPLMLSLKRPWARTRAMLLSTAVQIGLLFVLVPTHGHVGAAWAWLAMAVVFPFPIAIEFAMVARSWGRRRM